MSIAYLKLANQTCLCLLLGLIWILFFGHLLLSVYFFLFKKSFDFFKNRELTVVGGCIHGSPSICMGKVFLVLITTEEHCASLRPLALRPVLT
jgi:hypothetical protein